MLSETENFSLENAIWFPTAFTFAGPELPDDDKHWRLFGDVIAVVKPTSFLSFAAQVDVGYQERVLDDALWHAYAAYVRVAPADQFAIALRGEIFRDPKNGISGFRQTIGEVTLTFEYRPVEWCSIKLEGRYDESTNDVFAERDTAATGEREDQQWLAVCGVVVWF